jgi:F0F1-type ATP synthase assembly protein I
MDLTAHGHRHRDDRHHADKRALNEGFGDALARAVELVVTPMLFGFLGFLVDRWLGTGPAFMVALGGFTLGYTLWRMKSGYDAEMDKHQELLLRAPKIEAPKNEAPKNEARP